MISSWCTNCPPFVVVKRTAPAGVLPASGETSHSERKTSTDAGVGPSPPPGARPPAAAGPPPAPDQPPFRRDPFAHRRDEWKNRVVVYVLRPVVYYSGRRHVVPQVEPLLLPDSQQEIH